MAHGEGLLRPVRESDAAAVLAAFASDPGMARQGIVTDLAQAKSYLGRLLAPDGAHRGYAVTDDDLLVGLVAISVDETNRLGWFWYWMSHSHRGRGWTKRAATAVANQALSDGGLERLELGHRADNPVSRAVHSI